MVPPGSPAQWQTQWAMPSHTPTQHRQWDSELPKDYNQFDYPGLELRWQLEPNSDHIMFEWTTFDRTHERYHARVRHSELLSMREMFPEMTELDQYDLMFFIYETLLKIMEN